MTAIAALGLGLALALSTAPPAGAQAVAPASAATDPAVARAADLAFFRERFLNADRSYSPAARSEAEARLAALEAAGAATSPAAFELEIARIVALADNGHTATVPQVRSRGYNRAPVRLHPFGQDFYVLRATEAQADLLGARLVAIDGHAFTEVRAAAHTLTGGIPAWRDRFAAYFLESPEQLNALGMADAADAAVYVFETPDGRRIERRLEGEAVSVPRSRANIMRILSPLPPRDEPAGWRGLLDPASAPPALQDPLTPFRLRPAPEIDGVVIDLRGNADFGDIRIADALRGFETALREQRPRNLVLDMRLNGGGDLNLTRTFMKRLPELVAGRIFVLTSPWTFSAAISSTGYLEQAAPDRVTLVGEPVGDRLVFFSEGDFITLPNSGIMVLGATERHDYIGGCRAYSDCHAPVVRSPIAVPDLDPDIAAPWTLDAYRAGRDPAMEAVIAALR